ncbi:MAG: SDR family NAD(P)-dependent oxidoreductase [Candidatus Cloacimonetes bacterium]|nr:SDR family NAD(P)-dependent oxidoreductase [Candidatus Cloacimonadota bacterium]MDD4156251.1 SDR family NAD(P)-dependent oxidoreductase [Candidatus Cloacimonadota bacterium]
MKILVTGGAGFIGSHLCETLVKQHHKVICVDNFCDFYNPKIKENNLKELNKYPNFKFYNIDIRNVTELNAVFSKEPFDLMIHLAAMAGVRPSIENPQLYFDVNITGTVNLLEFCKKYNVKKIIFASSSSVYGNNHKVPFEESDPVDNPISPYAATKKSGELICHTYHTLYNMSIACLRFFTVYGPRQRPDLAIHKFTNMILNDEPIPVFGDGTTQRDYTYIDDILDGITKCIDYVFFGNKYQIFNLGESSTISLVEMISTIENTLNKKAKKNILPMQAGDVNRTFANISKSKKLLNYNPQTKFTEGIKKFIDWKLQTQ